MYPIWCYKTKAKHSLSSVFSIRRTRKPPFVSFTYTGCQLLSLRLTHFIHAVFRKSPLRVFYCTWMRIGTLMDWMRTPTWYNNFFILTLWLCWCWLFHTAEKQFYSVQCQRSRVKSEACSFLLNHSVPSRSRVQSLFMTCHSGHVKQQSLIVLQPLEFSCPCRDIAQRLIDYSLSRGGWW